MKRYLILGALAVFALMASACGDSETSPSEESVSPSPSPAAEGPWSESGDWTEVVSMTADDPSGDAEMTTSKPFTLSGKTTIVRIMIDEFGDHTYQGVEGYSGSVSVYVLPATEQLDPKWKPSADFSVSLNKQEDMYDSSYEARVGPPDYFNEEDPSDLGAYPAGDYRMSIEVQNATVTVTLLEEG